MWPQLCPNVDLPVLWKFLAEVVSGGVALGASIGAFHFGHNPSELEFRSKGGKATESSIWMARMGLDVLIAIA